MFLIIWGGCPSLFRVLCFCGRRSLSDVLPECAKTSYQRFWRFLARPVLRQFWRVWRFIASCMHLYVRRAFRPCMAVFVALCGLFWHGVLWSFAAFFASLVFCIPAEIAARAMPSKLPYTGFYGLTCAYIRL